MFFELMEAGFATPSVVAAGKRAKAEAMAALERISDAAELDDWQFFRQEVKQLFPLLVKCLFSVDRRKSNWRAMEKAFTDFAQKYRRYTTLEQMPLLVADTEQLLLVLTSTYAPAKQDNLSPLESLNRAESNKGVDDQYLQEMFNLTAAELDQERREPGSVIGVPGYQHPARRDLALAGELQPDTISPLLLELANAIPLKFEPKSSFRQFKRPSMIAQIENGDRAVLKAAGRLD
ncbi:MAG: hypothetical protein K8T91_23165 [Planctomycetes bacterium]|nr:hypothetical protein [Planctomycetota bacterium]